MESTVAMTQTLFSNPGSHTCFLFNLKQITASLPVSSVQWLIMVQAVGRRLHLQDTEDSCREYSMKEQVETAYSFLKQLRSGLAQSFLQYLIETLQ